MPSCVQQQQITGKRSHKALQQVLCALTCTHTLQMNINLGELIELRLGQFQLLFGHFGLLDRARLVLHQMQVIAQMTFDVVQRDARADDIGQDGFRLARASAGRRRVRHLRNQEFHGLRAIVAGGRLLRSASNTRFGRNDGRTDQWCRRRLIIFARRRIQLIRKSIAAGDFAINARLRNGWCDGGRSQFGYVLRVRSGGQFCASISQMGMATGANSLPQTDANKSENKRAKRNGNQAEEREKKTKKKTKSGSIKWNGRTQNMNGQKLKWNDTANNKIYLNRQFKSAFVLAISNRW